VITWTQLAADDDELDGIDPALVHRVAQQLAEEIERRLFPLIPEQHQFIVTDPDHRDRQYIVTTRWN
jgi:hypothetical protein